MTEHATNDAPAPSAGWPLPWWGMLSGAVFLAAMFTPLGAMMGVIAGFGLAMLSIPFIAAGLLIAGENTAPISALIGISGTVLLCVGVSIREIAKAPDRKARSLRMNKLALFIFLVAGLIVALLSLEDLWRY